MAGRLSRIVAEQACASVPSMGTYVPAANPYATHKGCAVLMPLGVPGAPCLLSFEYGPSYPFEPIIIKFLSAVSHPLVSSNGSIDLDILDRNQWSPALTLKAVLLSIQNMLTEPTHEDFLRAGCIRNPNWLAGSTSTPIEHVPKLFQLMLAAINPTRAGGNSAESVPWRALHCLEVCMREDESMKFAAASVRNEWQRFLGKVLVAERAPRPSAEGSALGDAQVSWERAARTLLHEHYHLDGLRVLVRLRSHPAHCSGELRRLSPMLWRMVREYVSCHADNLLFPPGLGLDNP